MGQSTSKNGYWSLHAFTEKILVTEVALLQTINYKLPTKAA